MTEFESLYCLSLDTLKQRNGIICPHMGGMEQALIERRAQLLNVPPHVLPEAFHQGSLPLKQGFLYLDCNHALLDAIKLSEDGSTI